MQVHVKSNGSGETPLICRRGCIFSGHLCDQYYTMYNIFSNFLCFASLFAHLSSILNNFNCNDENWILGK